MIYNSPSLVALIRFAKPGGNGETAADLLRLERALGCETGALGCDLVSFGVEYITAIGSSSQAPG